MKANLVFYIAATVVLFEFSSAQFVDSLEGKSAISTKYEARFHKTHANGVNTSEGYISGVHNMDKSTDEESWPSFAMKCAEVIKGIVSALTGAVTSEPGERTDLQLDFKNRIYHHDNRKTGQIVVESKEVEDPEDDNDDDYHSAEDHSYDMPVPSDNPMECLKDCDDDHVTEAPTEPTWNTPATREIVYRPTEEMPYYQDPPTTQNSLPPYQTTLNPTMDYFHETTYHPPGSPLPFDPWDHGYEQQQDFLREPSHFTISPEMYTTPPPVNRYPAASNPNREPDHQYEDDDDFYPDEDAHRDEEEEETTTVCPVATTENPLLPYGVPENVYKMFAPTSPPPPPLYIQISNQQGEGITEGPNELEEDCCCEEDTYDEETPKHKKICKTACRDLEQARNELKAIFDKIKKRLKCSRRLCS